MKRPVADLIEFAAGDVLGIVAHWPGTTGPIGDPGKSAIAGRLEGYRRYHVNVRGWTDIAYSLAVDQAGRVWDLRGLRFRSAANGDQAVNRTWVAVLALVGPGEKPTAAMVEGFREARALVLDVFPDALAVVGHKDVRAAGTDCPGPSLMDLIEDGVLAQDPSPVPPVAPFVLRRELSRGATGDDVAQLQRRLNEIRRPDIAVDGDFGPITESAVVSFQRRTWPLRPKRWDGIVGPLTAGALGWEFGR